MRVQSTQSLKFIIFCARQCVDITFNFVIIITKDCVRGALRQKMSFRAKLFIIIHGVHAVCEAYVQDQFCYVSNKFLTFLFY